MPRILKPWDQELRQAIDSIRVYNCWGFIETWDNFIGDDEFETKRWPEIEDFKKMTSVSQGKMKSIRLYKPLDDETDIGESGRKINISGI